MKNCSESLHRLTHRLEDTKAELKRKYPPGTYKDLHKGRFIILPTYKPGGAFLFKSYLSRTCLRATTSRSSDRAQSVMMIRCFYLLYFRA